MIFSGDFFQLLPVVDEGSGSNQKEFLNRGLAFESRAWRKAGLHTVLLQQVFRQVGYYLTKLPFSQFSVVSKTFLSVNKHLP